MQYPVLMRVMHGASNLRNQFSRLSDRHRLPLDYLVKLAALDESHAEIARAIALPHFMDWNDAGMLQASCRFRLPAKTLEVRFGGPGAKAYHLECHCAVEAFLMGPVNHALT